MYIQAEETMHSGYVGKLVSLRAKLHNMGIRLRLFVYLSTAEDKDILTKFHLGCVYPITPILHEGKNVRESGEKCQREKISSY